MLELPEAVCRARELSATVGGKTVVRLLPPTKPHKFCWWSADFSEYEAAFISQTMLPARAFGMYVEIPFTGDVYLCVNDGVNVRYYMSPDLIPKDYQLALVFADSSALVFSVAMYGGIVMHRGDYMNEYYIKSKEATVPPSAEFCDRFRSLLTSSKQNLSAKAFLATEQRFPGIGNGVVQDILLISGIHPKRKISILTEAGREKLLSSVIRTLSEMTAAGGRDTENDIFGNPGRYTTKMSMISYPTGCPICGCPIIKESYLGGSVYYCKNCQPIE